MMMIIPSPPPIAPTSTPPDAGPARDAMARRTPHGMTLIMRCLEGHKEAVRDSAYNEERP